MKNQTINISPQTIAFTVFFLIGLYLLVMVKEILLAFFIAVILMSAFNPSVTWLSKYKIPRPVGITLMYVLVFGLLGMLFSAILPQLGREVSGLVRSLQIPDMPPILEQFHWDFENIGNIINRFGSSLGSVFNIITTTFNGLVFFFTTIVLSFYLLLEREHLTNKIFWGEGDAKWRKFADSSLDKIEVKLGGWVRGQLFLMFIIGLITYLILTLLGIPHALPLAVLAGFLEILPNLGPTIASIPAIIIAFIVVSPSMAGVVAISYVLIQQVENHVIVPRIMKAAVDVDPLLSILLILSGVKIAGVFGALLAIPVFITARVLFFEYQKHKNSKLA